MSVFFLLGWGILPIIFIVVTVYLVTSGSKSPVLLPARVVALLAGLTKRVFYEWLKFPFRFFVFFWEIGYVNQLDYYILHVVVEAA